ncbi:MAG: formate dehydrogenase accessory sulfurtransferase FdhD [Prosthecobacter sp.]|uniref:formate dehydrogenase accessory sulfurtransferase FdhD n=1 Tax=Prosthecobacter sp. TaxID=1965333 RepID=UPI0038FF658E
MPTILTRQPTLTTKNLSLSSLTSVPALIHPRTINVEFAQAANQTLIGFLRGETMNVYTHPQRLTL